jgi:hypothetical protein
MFHGSPFSLSYRPFFSKPPDFVILVLIFNRPIGAGFRAVSAEFVMEFVLVAFAHQNELSIWYDRSNLLNGH